MQCTPLQNTLCLPSNGVLRSISSNLNINDGIQCINFLKKKADLLKPQELLVNLLSDEIHTKPCVNSVILDNNVINRSAFKLLAGVDILQPYFLIPVNKSKVYILSDSVHIIKCIRNNWLNVKSIDKTFTFPDFGDTTIIV